MCPDCSHPLKDHLVEPGGHFGYCTVKTEFDVGSGAFIEGQKMECGCTRLVKP